MSVVLRLLPRSCGARILGSGRTAPTMLHLVHSQHQRRFVERVRQPVAGTSFRPNYQK